MRILYASFTGTVVGNRRTVAFWAGQPVDVDQIVGVHETRTEVDGRTVTQSLPCTLAEALGRRGDDFTLDPLEPEIDLGLVVDDPLESD
jgi:hypothetical protein